MLRIPLARSASGRIRLVLAATIVAATALATVPALAGKPPATPVHVVRDTLHGVVIEDPYRWLEAKDAPETRAWITKQNAYTDSMLGAVPGRTTLREKVAQLLKVDAVGVPVERGGRLFFTKRRADQDLNVIYTRKGLAGPDEVLVDPHPLSPDHTTSVTFLDATADGGLIAYGTRQGGEDEIAITLLDVNARKPLADRLPRARYFGVSLAPDRQGMYYTHFDERGSRLFYHAFGTEPAKDKLIFGEGYGPDKIIASSLSEDGRWLLITVYYGSAAKKVELYLADRFKGGPPAVVVNDIEAFFDADIAGDRMIVRTNWNAPKWRMMAADLAHPEPAAWKEIVPEGNGVIDAFAVAGGKVFCNFLENVVSTVRVFGAEGRPLSTIELPTLGTFGGVRGRWKGDDAFFTFQSFHVPPTIYHYAVASGKRDEWWRAKVPFDSDAYELKQVRYASKDGTKIPMFLLHRKGMALDGARPTLLTGYGGFNVSNTPGFSARAAAWVEHGGVFALPSLRGGGEFGEAWHEAGMLEKKQNVFDDFIAAGEWLIGNRYTSSAKLGIEGGSNGGLLVGAAMAQRPELFGAVVCDVPLLDMLRYHKFLVARFWVPEYGSAENPEQFEFIRAYSPYQNVKRGVKYPAVLFVTGDSDTRVDPLHARKMTALMQAATGSGRPVLLHYDTKLGHSGGKPVSKQIDDLTDAFLFLRWQLGMTGDAVGVGAEAAGSGK